MDYEAFRKRSSGKKPGYQKMLKQLKRLPDNHVDRFFLEAHHRAFSEINCLDCAFCCTHVGPRWNSQDIRRASKSLKIKEADFEQMYLRVDEDGDFVFKSMPCPFLHADNMCSIYPDRPKACREYPHTDRSKMKQIFSLTIANSACCPAVERILDDLSGKLQEK